MFAHRHILNLSLLACGRCAAAVLATGTLLLGTFLLCGATGLPEVGTVQVPALEPVGSLWLAFHSLGGTVEVSSPLFPVLCFGLALPSLAGGLAVWRFFRQRWSSVA